MTTGRQLFDLLAPALTAGAVAVVLFQIMDRLNLFYRKRRETAEQHAKAA